MLGCYVTLIGGDKNSMRLESELVWYLNSEAACDLKSIRLIIPWPSGLPKGKRNTAREGNAGIVKPRTTPLSDNKRRATSLKSAVGAASSSRSDNSGYVYIPTGGLSLNSTGHVEFVMSSDIVWIVRG
jgi:hypothetical protein